MRLGAAVSLLCGTQLQSNPAPLILWRDPRGGVVTASDRVSFINDATGVRLNFYNSTVVDNGRWACNLTVTAQNVNVPPNSEVVSQLEVGQIQYDIDLVVVGEYWNNIIGSNRVVYVVHLFRLMFTCLCFAVWFFYKMFNYF